MGMNEVLGRRIKALRNANNLTQEQLADRIGVSRQKYARIENGTNSITLDILSKISAQLGISVGDITRVLDESPVMTRKSDDVDVSATDIYDMLDLFYANKHLYQKIQ